MKGYMWQQYPYFTGLGGVLEILHIYGARSICLFLCHPNTHNWSDANWNIVRRDQYSPINYIKRSN